MLRALFISLSKAEWAQRLITHWKFAWRMASRFIAGEDIEAALLAVKKLNQQGFLATLDHLGENTESLAAANQSAIDILSALDAIYSAGLRSNISIKLSQLGLQIDPEVTFNHLVKILERARLYDNFVRVDMEDSTLTEITLNLVRRARQAGYENTGVVLQSYLYRTVEDARMLASEGIRVRLVKGAYNEPASVAHPRKSDVDAAFDELVEILLQAQKRSPETDSHAAGNFPPLTAVASHDPRRIAFAQAAIQKVQLPQNAVEFQMLYGIRRDLQNSLINTGYTVRVYVPYGTHWYPYYMRRLAERPANVWFFLTSFFQK